MPTPRHNMQLLLRNSLLQNTNTTDRELKKNQFLSVFLTPSIHETLILLGQSDSCLVLHKRSLQGQRGSNWHSHLPTALGTHWQPAFSPGTR